MYRKHELLESKLCKELDLMEEKYRTGAEMSEGDLRKIDLLTHAIKSLATYSAMKENEEMRSYAGGPQNNSYGPSYGNSMYQQPDMGRFVGRDNRASGFMPYFQDERRW